MSTTKQNTVGSTFVLEGTGVHSGAPATLTIRPAAPNTGLRFRRVDLEDSPEIPANLDHVVGTELGTSLGRGEVRVLTVEHVLAALAALEIDNAILDLEGPEPPIRDGSFSEYFDAIRACGVEEQEAPAPLIEVRDALSVNLPSGESYVVAPADDYRISATIDFEHPAIGRQYGSFVLTTAEFEQEIAPARTFGFKAEAEALHAKGLALGASLENTVVLNDEGVMNEGLRYVDEFLRHKVGDMVGDLALLGARLQGHIVAERPSHRGNIELAGALAEQLRGNGDQPIVDVQRIMQHLPHRYPMLLVDRIIEYETGKRIVGIKNVTINEPFFQGHYPGHPIMPGVLVIEAMAQVGGLLLMDAVENPEDKVVYFMSLDNVKWRRPVTPGDQIVFELEMLQLRRRVCRMRGKGTVDGHLVAEADLMARIVDR
jgi:UDP-3-O-[3-hydroxymyristoyl] N-acetylglucosamine deacetylase/3-hydroxyacyl-[acyl-carrier-protein] dehydratase